MSNASILVGFVISTVGFSFFLYGKKQKRPPQLLVGLLQMIAPMLALGPLMMTGVGILSLLGLKLAIDRGL